MHAKYLSFIRNLRSSIAFMVFPIMLSCAHTERQGTGAVSIDSREIFTEESSPKGLDSVRCTIGSEQEKYELGDLVCARSEVTVSSSEELKIVFVVTNKESEDPYEYGYQELLRIKNGKTVERLRLRRSDDAYWSEVPFIRVRKQRYLADLDGDGAMEFSVLPFHPGSAIWMTARIYSLKDKIEYWGTGRYHFEGDTFVQLNCPLCSKFNLDACKLCE